MPRRDHAAGGRAAAEVPTPDANAAARPAPPPAEPPCTTAAAQLAYERPFTDAQKLDFAFRYAARAADRLDERAAADRYVAAALETLRCQVANAALRAQERDEQLGAAVAGLRGELRQVIALIEGLARQVEGALRAQGEANLLSDCYSTQAVEALARLSVAIGDLPRELRTFIGLAIADLSLGEAGGGSPAPVVLVPRERSVAAD